MIFPAKYNLRIWQGATFHYKFTYVDGDDVSNDPKDLTGCHGRMVIKDKPNGNVLIELNSSNNGVKINGSDGTIELFISANPDDNPNTSDVDWKIATYELFVENGQQVDVVLYGKITATSY